MANFCPQCGAKIKDANVRFCTGCGSSIAGGTGGSGRGASVTQTVAIGAMVVALGALAWAFTHIGTDDPPPSSVVAVAPASSGSPSTTGSGMSAPAGNTMVSGPAAATAVATDPAGGQWDARVQAIASRFLCGCGNCGDDTVWACDCTHPKGATEVKEFITKELQDGKTVPQIIESVKARYGHFIS